MRHHFTTGNWYYNKETYTYKSAVENILTENYYKSINGKKKTPLGASFF